jgi:transcriptional regulator with XRE-family HTH domain
MLAWVIVSNMGKHVTLAKRLKELRQAQGWTQQDLSRASGLSRSYISRLEMGDIALPSSERLRSLATSLGTTPDDLLQAAGFLDNPLEASDLPDLKVYLRRKYLINEPRVLQALETLVQSLPSTPSRGGSGKPASGDQSDLPISTNRSDQAWQG